MKNITVSIDDIPEATVVAGKNSRILFSNQLAQNRFKENAKLGRLAPWLESRHGWTCNECEDGTIVGVFRPDADETARAKTMLFATLSHEIRTPLNGIIGMAGLLGMSELTSAQRSWLGSVQDSGQHLLGLLNDILDYAKLESGKIDLETVNFDPVHTLQSIAEICSPRAHEKGLDIMVAIGKNIPKKVSGDDGRLRQIILNLASNAVKFTHEGGIVLRIDVRNSEHLCFCVEDSGIGVPQDKIETIFDEFAQADSSHTRQYGGTGLGLAIVKRLSKAMGGDVKIMQNPRGGTIFSVELPFKTVEPATNEYNFKNKKIAIATKSDVLYDVLSCNLGVYGANVIRFNSTKDLRGVKTILLDDGFESDAIDTILKGPPPCIAMIGQEKRELIETYREKGAFGYLIKPLRLGSLLERVKLALDNIVDDMIEVSNDERADNTKKLSGVRVLLAEDNRINALLAKSLLERMGCDVVTVGNGEEAVQSVQTTPYDLVFMDFHMPVMDGLAATQQIRALGLKALPIIALTAAAMEEDRRACSAAGMDDFITKPLELNALETILQKWVSGNAQKTLNAA
ncbi:response regulator [Pseudaquidulcibacter saccharophilus]|uniref:response regulator n=1 Tax=Pseudaquidulcibacter saccharophilus TaxID=2831900 RepID=UPI001EFF48E4|nr:response regulator [Pseudaquidulcibacter saccharophilus]